MKERSRLIPSKWIFMRWILSRLEWSLPINHLFGMNKANDLFILSVVDTVTRRPGLGRIVRDLACLSGLKNRSGIYTTISVRKFEKNVRVKKGKFSINFNWHPGVFFLKSGVSEAGDLATLFIDHPHPGRKRTTDVCIESKPLKNCPNQFLIIILDMINS